MFGGVPRTFNTHFRCYSVVMFPGNEREDVERGGKSKLVFFIQYLGIQSVIVACTILYLV